MPVVPKECFESIGGYTPLKVGAIDLVAVVSARMNGWKTETFTEKYCVHHRPMGTAKNNILTATFKSGYGDYRMGVHPAWQVFRSIYQMTRKPMVINGIMLLAGYFWAYAYARCKNRFLPNLSLFEEKNRCVG